MKARWQGPTIAEISAACGLSTATVDRVINQRAAVSAEKTARVWQALERLDGRRPPPDAVAPRRIALLSLSGYSFNAALAETAGRAAETAGISLSIATHGTHEIVPEDFAAEMRAAAETAEGLILVAFDHPAINEAVREIVARGRPVICLTTDLPSSGRTAYVGLNQVTAGCIAAGLIGRALGRGEGSEVPKRVMLVVSAPFRCQEERESGFRRVMRREYPHLLLAEHLGCDDKATLSYAVTREMIARWGPPDGVYNLASGNAGIVRALEEAGLGGRCLFVGHEFTERSRRLLQAGRMDYVIDRDTGAEMEAAFRLIAAARDGRTGEIGDRISQPLILTKYHA